MKLSKLTKASIRAALKRSNQRIAQIGNSVGKNSTIYNNQIAPFVNTQYEEYLRTTEGGKSLGRAGKKGMVTKGGNIAFDIHKIMKAIESGKMDESEVNDFLLKATGNKINKDGDFVVGKVVKDEITGEEYNVSQGGISTMKEIKEQAKKTIPNWKDYDSDELLQKYDDIIEARDNFQVDYDAYMEEYGLRTAKTDPTIKKLYKNRFKNNEKTGKKKKFRESFDYEDFIDVYKELKRQTAGLQKKAKTDPGKNGKVVFGGNRKK